MMSEAYKGYEENGVDQMLTRKKAVVLLSGGIDSATCCTIAQAEGFAVYALSFDYGQRHRIELQSAQKVAQKAAVAAHSIITIDLRVFGGSSLTADIAVPKNRPLKSGAGSDIPNTYVPARNAIFLSYALGWAEVLASTDIYIGVNAIDYSGYPDCRPGFIAAFETMANCATKSGVEGRHLTIHTPLLTLTKAEIIRKGRSLGIDYSHTLSCYDPSEQGIACGCCDSCILRKKGFLEAGIEDPAKYRV